MPSILITEGFKGTNNGYDVIEFQKDEILSIPGQISEEMAKTAVHLLKKAEYIEEEMPASPENEHESTIATVENGTESQIHPTVEGEPKQDSAESPQDASLQQQFQEASALTDETQAPVDAGLVTEELPAQAQATNA